MKNLILNKSYLWAVLPLFLMAVNAKKSTFNFNKKTAADRLTIVTDESWEVSKAQTEFGEYPLSKTAVLAANAGLKGGNAPAVVARYVRGSTLIEGAKPIWLTYRASDDWEVRQLKKVFMLRNNLMSAAILKVNCDDAARVYINGQLIAKDLNKELNTSTFNSSIFKQLSAYFYDQIYTYDIKSFLKAGALNTILIEVASEPHQNGHAYLSARMDIDFIEKTIGLIAENKVVNEQKKPIIKAEKKPIIVPKKTIKIPEKVEEKTPLAIIKPIDNQLVTPTEKSEINVFRNSNDINVSKLKIGDVFELGNIYFKTDDAHLNDDSKTTLLELATLLKANNTMKIEIGGHTNLVAEGAYAKSLSSERAKSVREFLVINGVFSENLTFKGYGKSQPKIAEKTTEANRRNQRVEVKILAK
jgi:outer membrane protein OmpA-like peptidoglycan-associated protein